MSQLSAKRLAIVTIASCVLGGASRIAADVDPAEGRVVVQALAGEGPLRERLEGLRPLPAEAYLELLVSGRVPGEWIGAGSTGRALTLEERQGLFAVLVEAPFRTLQPHLNEIARSAPEWRSRVLAMRLLRDASQPEAIHLLVDLSIPQDDSLVVPRSVRTTFVATLRQLLSNDARNVSALRPVLGRVPPGLMTGVFEVLEVYPARTVLDLIAVSLGRVPELDPLLLTYAARHASRTDGPFDPLVTEAVRGYLSRDQVARLSPAARAAGELGDYAAVPELIALLEHQDASVRQAAHGALGRITDLPFPAEFALWDGWYRDELRWWETKADQLLHEVRAGTPEQCSRALREISTKRLHRDELARSLVESLHGADGRRGEAICAVLERLFVRELLGPLHEIARNHPDGRVRDGARRLTERMTR